MKLRIVFLACLVSCLLAPAANAINCRSWDRLGPAQKSATIDRMIQDAVAGPRGRSYQVNRGEIGRCLQRYAQSMQNDFDDACADARTAGMQALNHIFKNYIWSCVR